MNFNENLILEHIKLNRGFITSAQITELATPRHSLPDLVNMGEIYKSDIQV